MSKAISDLRYYLRCWRRWLRSWRPALGFPPEAPFVRLMRPVVSWGNPEDHFQEEGEDIEDWILRAIDAEVESLPEQQKKAIRQVYLREWHNFKQERATMLCDRAEADMVSRLRAKGVVLGGE